MMSRGRRTDQPRAEGRIQHVACGSGGARAAVELMRRAGAALAQRRRADGDDCVGRDCRRAVGAPCARAQYRVAGAARREACAQPVGRGGEGGGGGARRLRFAIHELQGTGLGRAWRWWRFKVDRDPQSAKMTRAVRTLSPQGAQSGAR